MHQENHAHQDIDKLENEAIDDALMFKTKMFWGEVLSSYFRLSLSCFDQKIFDIKSRSRQK